LCVEPIDEYSERLWASIFQLHLLSVALDKIPVEGGIEKGGVVAYEVLMHLEDLRFSGPGEDMHFDDRLGVPYYIEHS
jgi:hypothetical protein